MSRGGGSGWGFRVVVNEKNWCYCENAEKLARSVGGLGWICTNNRNCGENATKCRGVGGGRGPDMGRGVRVVVNE